MPCLPYGRGWWGSGLKKVNKGPKGPKKVNKDLAAPKAPLRSCVAGWEGRGRALSTEARSEGTASLAYLTCIVSLTPHQWAVEPARRAFVIHQAMAQSAQHLGLPNPRSRSKLLVSRTVHYSSQAMASIIGTSRPTMFSPHALAAIYLRVPQSSQAMASISDTSRITLQAIMMASITASCFGFGCAALVHRRPWLQSPAHRAYSEA